MSALTLATMRYQRAEIELRAAAAALRKLIARHSTSSLACRPRKLCVFPKDRRIIAIQITVAHHHGIEICELLGRSKVSEYVVPRQRAMSIARTLLRVPLEAVGEAFGKDHGTVIHAVRVVEARCATEPGYRQDYERLLATCSEQLRKDVAA